MTDWQAVAQAHLERGEPALARRAARRAGPPTPELRLLLAWIEQDSGNSRACERHLDLAEPHLRGALLARARCLRGLTRCVAGDYDEALQQLNAAIRGSRRHGDHRWVANALNARGVVRTYLRLAAAASRDLVAAQQLYASLGEHERAATCLHNRGFLALQAGDPSRALDLFDAAIAAGLHVGARGEALIDRAYALLALGQVVAAGDALNRAAALLGGARRSMRLAEATLAFGRCAARAGRVDLARDAVRRAKESFRAQHRVGWLAAADALELRLNSTPDAVQAARAVARRCIRYGFRVEAAELRALAWLARARLADDPRSVLAACRAGLRTGAVEVADDLTRTGLRAVLASGDAAAVLRWVSGVSPRELATCLAGKAFVQYLDDQILSLVDGQVHLGDGPVLDDRAVVVVPSAGLRGLSWAAMEIEGGRPVSVVPSARAWLRASQVELRLADPVWVAGPGLQHADREVTELHGRWGGTLLGSRESTMDAVLEAMDGAGLVHIAAHGRQAGVELADGVLRVHDVDRLARPPRILVLSACECATTPVLPKGTRAVLASVVPVVDAAAVGLVLRLHEYLRAGCGPAEALARLGGQGFVCVGAG